MFTPGTPGSYSFTSHCRLSYVHVPLCCCPGVLGAVYLVGLMACLLIGSREGPKVFDHSPPDVIDTPSLDNVTWYGKVDGMKRWHQVRTVIGCVLICLHSLRFQGLCIRKPVIVTPHDRPDPPKLKTIFVGKLCELMFFDLESEGLPGNLIMPA